MTKADRLRRKNYLPGGYKGLEVLLAKANGNISPVKASMIGAIIRGERADQHGVMELFKEVTDAEKKRRERVAKQTAKQLEV